MVEILKLGDQSAGLCTPTITSFEGSIGALTNVFIGTTRSSVLVQGDFCVAVDCDPGPGVTPCIPTLNLDTECCSLNVFAGPNRLPVGILGGGLTCGYVGQGVSPSFVNVN